jgi:3-methylfumaryl-CoA hydratase
MTLDDLRAWVGREQHGEDILTEDLARKFVATFDDDCDPPRNGEPAPGLIHFCLAQPVTAVSKLGPDGHPERGEFLPPVPLPRRMWAGGNLRFHRELLVGETITRRSRIADIVTKQGRSGALCFVNVEHSIEVEGLPVIEEEQTIVYRAASDAPTPGQQAEPAAIGDHCQNMLPTPVTMFRYSALTFNSHRIHYDLRYATEVEGYPDLVVHGPLVATCLHRYAKRLRGAAPSIFAFRGQSPMFAGEAILMHAQEGDDGRLSLWAARRDGSVAMTANAGWS